MLNTSLTATWLKIIQFSCLSQVHLLETTEPGDSEAMRLLSFLSGRYLFDFFFFSCMTISRDGKIQHCLPFGPSFSFIELNGSNSIFLRQNSVSLLIRCLLAWVFSLLMWGLPSSLPVFSSRSSVAQFPCNSMWKFKVKENCCKRKLDFIKHHHDSVYDLPCFSRPLVFLLALHFKKNHLLKFNNILPF